MSAITIMLIILVALLAGMEGILDEFQFHQPLVACTLIGLVSGHLSEGIILGGSLQMIALGWANVGAAVAPDAALASVASAIIMVLGLNGGTVNTQTAISTSIAVAIPLSVAGLFLTMICRTIAIPLVHLMDGAAEKGDFRKIEIYQILGILLQGVRIAVPAAALCIVPAEAVTSVLNQMPAWLSGGMTVGGGMVAAVGYAMVINMMSTKETWPFFAIGFVLAALSELTLIALGALGVAIALIYLGLKENGGSGNGGSTASLGGYKWNVSIGATGHLAVGDNNNFSYINGYAPSATGNDGLKWETSEQTNIGIDARFLNSRLTVTADYFHKKTKDLIVSGIKASTVVGNSFSPVNAGNITNKGFELELGWQDRIGDFAYGVRANVATLKNKVTKMHESLSSIDGATYVTYGAITRFEVGKPAWYFYGYDFMGVDSKTGEPIFRDIDGVEGITDNDKTEIGKGIADYTYGITLNAAWKGFDFILFGTGSQGNDVFCGLNRVDYNLNQLTYFTKNRWTESNRNGKTPASGATDYTKYLTSSGCVFDGSYFKIKQIQLGYSFPKQLIKKVAIENLRIYGSLEDFFTFTDYPGFDPEVTGVGNSLGVDKGSYPNSKKVVLGLSVTF